MTDREAFEAWGDRHGIPESQRAWSRMAWLACAALASERAVQAEPVADVIYGELVWREGKRPAKITSKPLPLYTGPPVVQAEPVNTPLVGVAFTPEKGIHAAPPVLREEPGAVVFASAFKPC